MDNLCAIFLRQFELTPDKIAIYAGDRAYSYKNIKQHVIALTGILSSYGLQPGDRVVMQVKKSPEALFVYLASLLARLIIVPLNPSYKTEEVRYFIEDSAPKLFIHDPQYDSVLPDIFSGNAHRPQCVTFDEAGRGTLMASTTAAVDSLNLREFEATDVAVIIYTSGTTGRPKGAMLTHQALYNNATALVDAWGITQADTLLHSLPIFHVHGLFFACHTIFLTNASMRFLPKFDEQTVVQYLPESTLFMGVPTYYTRLLELKSFNRFACARMRLFISGSAPLLSATFEAFQARTGHTILERYGMSETGINTSNPLHGRRVVSAVGLPITGVELRIVDEADQVCETGTIGHVEIKSSHLFKGYWRMPEKTAADFTEDGYFKTGDQGKLDEAGYLYLIGRAKDMVISGGLNVYPKEIEVTIDSLVGVTESAVIGVPHPDFGEAVVAVVAGEKQPANEAVIIDEVRQRHADYKVPKKVILVDQLPKNTMGKVQKNRLRMTYDQLFA